jgi:multicomponent Na+:H+ antiporter subunit F
VATIFIVGALVVLLVGIGCCLTRMLRGPTPFDRVLAFEAVALNIVGLTILISILLDTEAFIDVILVVALLGFLGTVSIAAYLEGTLVDS